MAGRRRFRESSAFLSTRSPPPGGPYPHPYGRFGYIGEPPPFDGPGPHLSMRIALVQTYHRYTQFTHVHPLGIMMIAAYARERGHEDVHLLDMKVEDWDPDRCVDELEKLGVDVVGLSAMTYEAGCLHEVAKLAKKRIPGIVVVAGGSAPERRL